MKDREMIRFFGLLVMFSLLVPQICIAQDANTNAELISSIDKLSKRDVLLVGSIDEEVQEQPVADGIAGGFQRVIIPGMSLGSTREFRGDAEVLVSKNGDLVIASKEELPGVKVFKTGEDVLSLQAHMKEPFSTSKLVGDLSKLFDWIALGNAVESAAEIQTRVKGKDTEFRVILDRSFIPSEIVAAVPAMPAGVAAGAAAGNVQNVQIRIGGNPMMPTITELAVTFKMNAAKEIVRLEYALQYSLSHFSNRGLLSRGLDPFPDPSQSLRKPPRELQADFVASRFLCDSVYGYIHHGYQTCFEIIDSADNDQLLALDKLRNNRRCFCQDGCLIANIVGDRLVQVSICRFYGWPNVLKQSAYLTRYLAPFHRRRDGPAIRVTQDKEHLGSKNLCPKLQTADVFA